MTLTTASRFWLVSARVVPSGATSRSWKQKKGAPSFSMNSKATRTRLMALSTESCAALPGPQHRARPERIGAGAPHRVPVGHAEAEVVLHRLAFDHFALVVVAERQGVLRLRAFVLDLGGLREKRAWVDSWWLVVT